MGPIDNEPKIGPTAVSRSISNPVCQKLTFEGREKDCHFVATSLYQHVINKPGMWGRSVNAS